jgi:protein TonB
VAPDFSRNAANPEDFAPMVDSTTRRAGPAVWATALQRLDPLRVDELPVPVVSNPPPVYPQALQQAHVGGQVVVEFLIDSTGVIDLGSLRVVESTDNQFTQAVRRVLPRMRFLPAQLGPRAVGVTVRQPFVFVIRPGR